MYYVVARKRAVLLDETGKVLDTVQPANAGDLQGNRELKMESFVVTVDGDPIDEPVSFHKEIESPAESEDPREADCIKAAKVSPGAHLHAILYTKDKSKKNRTWHDGYMSFDGKLAMFYDDEHKVILKKDCGKDQLADGSIVETGLYIIEVTGPIAKAPKKRSLEDNQEDLSLNVEYDCDLDADEPTFELVYTEDVKKRAKKWIDGRLVYSKASGAGKFYDESGKLLFKRGLAWRQIDQQEEIHTARYIFQIGAQSNSEFVPLDPPAKKIAGRREEFKARPEDEKLFMEHAVQYTGDVQKKNKQWCEGHLWYDSGMCKVFDEDGKQIYKASMSSEAIKDGVEMKTWKHIISIGHQVHRYLKDAGADEPKTEKRSADELAAFFGVKTAT